MKTRPGQPIDLEGRRALVTGASRGIGRAIALDLSARGVAVACSGRDEGLLSGLVEAVTREGGRAEVVAGDLADPTDREHLVSDAVDRLGGLDILINNAATVGAGTIDSLAEADWEATIAANLTAPFALIRGAVPHLAASGRGAVVNIGSINGVVSMPGLPAYCAAKGGLHHLTRQAALDLAPQGIRVNCVAPGFVRTDMFEQHHSTQRQAEIGRLHALGRVGEPEEIANLVAFVCSDLASFVTGAVLMVDGGLTVQFGFPSD